MVLSFTFRELGQAALSDGSAWATPVVLRSSLMHKAKGGWSSMLRMFLDHLLQGPSGLATVGMATMVGDTPTLIHATLSNILTDGPGFAEAFDWKGHPSLKPCFKHWNVCKKVSLRLCVSNLLADRSPACRPSPTSYYVIFELPRFVTKS